MTDTALFFLARIEDFATMGTFGDSMRKILLLNIVLFIAIAAASAKIVADVVARRLSNAFPSSLNMNAPPPSPAVSEDLMAFSPILENGLFGKATQGKLVPFVAPSSKADTPSMAISELQLLGTAVGSFRETFALVQKVSTREERVFRLGEKVFDVGQLVAVQKESIVLSVGGRREKIFAPSAIPSSDGGQAKPAASSPGLARQVGGGSYVINQRALDAALANIGQAMGDARMLPSMKDGKVEGFRVTEVRPGGIFTMVGIRNGDILLRINDFAINSPENAMQSLASLKGLNRITLDLIRDGQPTTLNYDIR